jgi:hypothetical protein
VTLLASDIAKAIQHPNADPIATLTKIRNWSKTGALKPIGDPHPGGGKALRYSDGAILDAALIQELVNAGVPTVEVGQVLENIKGAEPQIFAPEFFKAPTEPEHTLLVLSKAQSNSNVWNYALHSPETFAAYAKRRLCAIYLIVDLKTLSELMNKNI